ncbi:MAG: hypothetical protein IJK81_13665 [Selenomonadaceae bacterium]|nr:hypothetical protein [Selenomonadaceae bacterium]
MSNPVKARIAYVGSSLENGEMEIRELVPALLAFSDLVEHANRVLGGKQRIKVMLNQDSLKRGSFDITFLLEASIIEQAKIFFGFSPQISLETILLSLGWSEFGKVADVVTVSTPVVGGVFWLIKKIRGKKIDRINHKNDRVEITLNDGERILTDENTLKIFLDIKCRVSIEKIIEPVKREGIEAFELRNPESKNDDKPIERIRKDEASLFDAPAEEFPNEELKPSLEQEGIFKIVSVNFDDGKWKFNDGDSSFWASMEDKGFNVRIKNREINFACGDMLAVKYFTQQRIRNGNLTKETTVIKVIKVMKQPEQITLNFAAEENKKAPSE